jgi:hypothetical protein
MSNPSAAEETKYFDLHVNGLGYLGRIREVKPKRGAPFVACSINAFRGQAGAVEYTKFDVKCTGRNTAEIVRLLEPMVKDKKRVIVGFRVADIYPDSYVAKGTREGEMIIELKGRLLKVSFAKCEGQSVDLSQFADPPADSDAPAQSSGQAA